MAHPLPSCPPTQFSAGDAAQFTVQDDGFTGVQWALSRAGKSLAAIQGALSAGQWLISIPDSSALAPGVAQWAIYGTDAGGRRTVQTGTLTILPNLAADRAPSPAEAMLAACETALTKILGKVNATVNFNGQSFTGRDPGALISLRDQLRAEVSAEQAVLGGGRNWKTIQTVL